MVDSIEDTQFERVARRVEPQGTLLRAWPLQGGVSAQVTALEVSLPDGRSRKLVVRRHGAGDLFPSIHDLDGGPLAQLEDADKLRSSLRRLMWGKVGLIRTADSLARAIAQLCKWERLVSRPFGMRHDLEVKNMVQVARCIAEAALWRENSVGAHYRADYPKLDGSRWKQHSQWKRVMDVENLKASRSGAMSERKMVGSRKGGKSVARHTVGKTEALF